MGFGQPVLGIVGQQTVGIVGEKLTKRDAGGNVVLLLQYVECRFVVLPVRTARDRQPAGSGRLRWRHPFDDFRLRLQARLQHADTVIQVNVEIALPPGRALRVVLERVRTPLQLGRLALQLVDLDGQLDQAAARQDALQRDEPPLDLRQPLQRRIGPRLHHFAACQEQPCKR